MKEISAIVNSLDYDLRRCFNLSDSTQDITPYLKDALDSCELVKVAYLVGFKNIKWSRVRKRVAAFVNTVAEMSAGPRTLRFFWVFSRSIPEVELCKMWSLLSLRAKLEIAQRLRNANLSPITKEMLHRVLRKGR